GSGSRAKSQLGRQILADELNVELVTVNTTEGAAYGAALLAGVGVKMWPDVDAACAQKIKTENAVAPNPADVSKYETLYPHYRNLYATLRPTFVGLSATEE